MQTVEDFIGGLPKDEQLLASHLRTMILDMDPRIQEKLSYGVPYFSRHRRICFVWPASARYGPKDAKMIIGFCNGNLLSNDQKILIAENRKQVYLIKISSLKEINESVLKEIIQEAILVDDQFKIKKKKKNG